MFHVHVDPPGFKLVQHLGKPFVFGLLTLRPAYPADVIVLLIRRTILVGTHQTSLIQCKANELRHRMLLSFQARKIRTHSFPFSSAAQRRRSAGAEGDTMEQPVKANCDRFMLETLHAKQLPPPLQTLLPTKPSRERGPKVRWRKQIHRRTTTDQ